VLIPVESKPIDTIIKTEESTKIVKCLIGDTVATIDYDPNTPVNVISKKRFNEIRDKGNFITFDDIKSIIDGKEYHGFMSTWVEMKGQDKQIRRNFYYSNDQDDLHAVLRKETIEALGVLNEKQIISGHKIKRKDSDDI
jgi:hypothetical protein